jgi:Cro/C1-type HTH DNA-binding domain
MTTLHVVDGGRSESLTELVARRLRGQLAERKIKRKDVIEMTGWGRATVYRRLSGQTPLDTDELDALWRLFDISPAYLMSGVSDSRPWPGPGGGSGQGLLDDPGGGDRQNYWLGVAS